MIKTILHVSHILVFAVVLGLASCDATVDVGSHCRSAYTRGDYRQSFDICSKAANDGVAIAQVVMANMLMNGQGLEKDEIASIKWYRMAAEQGLPIAGFHLGQAYFHGRGVESDLERALGFFTESAQAGLRESQEVLGTLYLSGMGVEKDFVAAANWLTMAAEQGSATAASNLGVLYEKGEKGVLSDFSVAADWYRMAADRGDARAQNRLGIMYLNQELPSPGDDEVFKLFSLAANQGWGPAQTNLAKCYADGIGVAVDYVLAAAWLKLAQRQEQKDADSSLDRVQSNLSEAEVESAQLIAEKWMRSFESSAAGGPLFTSFSSKDSSFLNRYEVCDLEEYLFELGYMNSMPDGVFLDDTSNALESMQKKIGQRAIGLPTKSALLMAKKGHASIPTAQIQNQPKEKDRRPATGFVYVDGVKSGPAPLEVLTSSSGDGFYVKVTDISNKASTRAVFIRSGDVWKTKLPVGSYELTYAGGNKWFNDKCYFGIRTAYSKAEKIFKFSRNANQVNGFRVELILQSDGNLSTERINRAQF